MARKPPHSYWQEVPMDSREMSASEAIRRVNKVLKRSPYRAVKAKPAKRQRWGADGGIAPYLVRFVKKGDGVLE